MKKIVCLFLTVAFVFVLISCAEQKKPIGTTDGTASSPTSVPTSPSSSVSGETETTETSATLSSTTGEHGEIGTTYHDVYGDGNPVFAYVYPLLTVKPENGIDPREIGFQSFYGYLPDVPWEEQTFPQNERWPIRGAYGAKKEIKGYFNGWKAQGTTDWDPLIATVLSYDPDQCQLDISGMQYCEYYVTFSSYSGEKNDEIFMMEYLGRADRPYYGRPVLIPGKRYMRLLPMHLYKLEEQEENIINDAVLFMIEEQDGVEYVYGINANLSNMDCAIPITDPYENAVYKPGIDDVIIAFMEEHDIPAPTYDYKCELHAFVKEMNDDID